MTTAMDIYINRVDKCPCGETCIHLCKGADSSDLQERRAHLIQYLKGTIKEKQVLEQQHKELYDHFEKIWGLRNRHLVEGLPSQYLFYLVCCGKSDCCHPACSSTEELPLWFPGGPSLQYLPLPVRDPERPWGNKACKTCKGECFGHYLLPEQAVKLSKHHKPMSKPPSIILKEGYGKLAGKKPSSDYINQMARETLLSPHEVEMWFDHLKVVSDNRKRAAAKAAATRKKKRALQQSGHQTEVAELLEAQTSQQASCLGSICAALNFFFSHN